MTRTQNENRRLFSELEVALQENDHDSLLIDILPTIDANWCWPDAMRRIANMNCKVNPQMRLLMYRVWSHHGDYIRPMVSDDLLLIRALRKLLPAYGGGPKKLYRGESAENRKNQTYGLSWTPRKTIARGYCSYNQAYAPSVLLMTVAPPEAIIVGVRKAYDDYGDHEYLVDRRYLNRVEVVEKHHAKALGGDHGENGVTPSIYDRRLPADLHHAIRTDPQANDNWPPVLTRCEAAKMCRISVQTFDSWVRKGILPGPILGTRRWSRSAIEQALAGDVSASLGDKQLSPFEQWKRGNAH
jgi:hypothetical protein